LTINETIDANLNERATENINAPKKPDMALFS
jgi:hypothetical protein